MPNGKGNIIVTGQVSANSTAASLIADNRARVMLEVANNGTADAYIGLSTTVTTTNGFLVKAGTVVQMPDYTGPAAVVTSGTTTTVVSYVEY